MKKKKTLNLILLLLTFCTYSQQKVCESNNDLIDLNSIHKCPIEEFKSTKSDAYSSFISVNRVDNIDIGIDVGGFGCLDRIHKKEL